MNKRPLTNYGVILRASSITGLAHLTNLLCGLCRMKVAAILLGPSGVGLIGLFQSAMGTASTIGDLGLRQAGARQMAEAIGNDDEEAITQTRLALIVFGFLSALVTGLTFFILRERISILITGKSTYASDVGWLSIGVATSVATGSYFAILNGNRNVAALGWVASLSALLGSIIAVAALMLVGSEAIVFFVAAVPIVNFLLIVAFGQKRKVQLPVTLRFSNLVHRWAAMLKLGIYVLLGALTLAGSELAVRIMVYEDLGAQWLGLFTATWVIGVYYVHFLMTATSYEFYPRIVAAQGNNIELNNAIDAQIQILMLISGAIFIFFICFGKFIVNILYSNDFTMAQSLLRVMVIGDLFRVIYYPLTFVLLASARGLDYISTKLLEGGLFLALVYASIENYGIAALGWSHVITFFTVTTYSLFLIRYRTGYFPHRQTFVIFSLLLLSIILSYKLTENLTFLSGFAGIAVFFAWIAFALTSLRSGVIRSVES